MSAALGGVLSVNKRVELLAHLRGMGDDNLNVVAGEVHERVEGVVGHVLVHQVAQAVARVVALAVVVERESCVQERVVLDHHLDDVIAILIVLEDGGIGGELHKRAVLVVGIGAGDSGLVLYKSFLIGHRRALPVAHRADVETRRQGIHSLDAHTVEANGSLIVLGVVFGAGIHLARGVLHLVERNTTAVVANGYFPVLDGDVDARLGKASVELVD